MWVSTCVTGLEEYVDAENIFFNSGFCIAEWSHLKWTTGYLRHVTIIGVI
jgi:hypothetical protein